VIPRALGLCADDVVHAFRLHMLEKTDATVHR
jgi:hypothetical protein